MSNFSTSDLRDPQPPVPGERERARVAARAHELGRRRRLVQGGGALALVAAVAVSVAALTAGGTSGPGRTNRVAAASSGSDTTVSTPTSSVAVAPTTAAPTPDTTPAPQVAPDTTPAPAAQEVAPVAPVVVQSTFSLSGTVSGNPADTTVTLTIIGPSGSLEVPVAGGSYSVSGLDAGDYSIIGFWTDTATGTASRAQQLGSVTLSQDSSANLVFQG